MADAEPKKKPEEATPEESESRKEAEDVLSRTVFVENLRTSVEKLARALRPQFAEKFGEGAVQSLVRRRDGYEVTFSSGEAARECLERGLVVEKRSYDAVAVAGDELLVTLASVPAYVDDAAVARRLRDLGCAVVGDVRRVTIEGVETGRRKVLVRLPQGGARSLPRAIVVKAACGRDERIELFHRNQRIRKITR